MTQATGFNKENITRLENLREPRPVEDLKAEVSRLKGKIKALGLFSPSHARQEERANLQGRATALETELAGVSK